MIVTEVTLVSLFNTTWNPLTQHYILFQGKGKWQTSLAAEAKADSVFHELFRNIYKGTSHEKIYVCVRASLIPLSKVMFYGQVYTFIFEVDAENYLNWWILEIDK